MALNYKKKKKHKIKFEWFLLKDVFHIEDQLPHGSINCHPSLLQKKESFQSLTRILLYELEKYEVMQDLSFSMEWNRNSAASIADWPSDGLKKIMWTCSVTYQL